MLAKIGGFFNALYIFVLLISKNYIDFSYYKYIYNHFCQNQNNEENAIGNNKINISHSLVKQQTIDKLAMKIAYSNIYQANDEKKNNINASNLININKSSFADLNSNAIKDLKPYNNLIESINKNNSSNLNNNYIYNEQPSKLNISNNIMNNESNKIDIAKIDKQDLNSAQPNYIPNNNPNHNMINLDNNKEIPNEFNPHSHMFNDSHIKTYAKNVNYNSFLWNDIVCCRNKFLFQKKAVEKVISFENLVEVSYDYYIRNNKE